MKQVWLVLILSFLSTFNDAKIAGKIHHGKILPEIFKATFDEFAEALLAKNKIGHRLPNDNDEAGVAVIIDMDMIPTPFSHGFTMLKLAAGFSQLGYTVLLLRKEDQLAAIKDSPKNFFILSDFFPAISRVPCQALSADYQSEDACIVEYARGNLPQAEKIEKMRLLLALSSSFPRSVFFVWHHPRWQWEVDDIWPLPFWKAVNTSPLLVNRTMQTSEQFKDFHRMPFHRAIPFQFASARDPESLREGNLGFEERTYDAWYVGNWYQEAWLSRLEEEQEVDVFVRTTGTSVDSWGPETSCPENVRVQTMRMSRVVLGFHSEYNIEHGIVTERVWEGISHGCVVLTDNPSAVSATEGVAVLVRTYDDLMRELEVYNTNRSMWERQTEMGYSFAVRTGTYKHRAELIVRAAEDANPWGRVVARARASVTAISGDFDESFRMEETVVFPEARDTVKIGQRRKILHLGFHTGVREDLDHLSHVLDLEIDHEEYPRQGRDDCAKFNIDDAHAAAIWREHGERWSEYDIVITSDTAPIARPLLQYGTWVDRILIVWVCNRFDYKCHGPDHRPLMTDFPEASFYELYANASDGKLGPNVHIVPYTQFEVSYALQYGVNISATVIKPTGLKSLAPVSEPRYSRKEMGDIYFLLPRHNDRYMQHQCPLLGLDCFRGPPLSMSVPLGEDEGHLGLSLYSSARELTAFKAVIHIPHAWSNVALFEMLQAGVVVLVPTARFFIELNSCIAWGAWLCEMHSDVDDNDFIFFQNQEDFATVAQLSLSEWWVPSNRDSLIHFDSWEDLVRKTSSLEWKSYANHSEFLQRRMAEHVEETAAQWRKLMRFP